MRKVFPLLVLAALVLTPSLAVKSEYSPYAMPRSSGEFVVPQRLRPRVNFWKDVFTKYGRHHIIVHHRAFPQAVFDVVDLTGEAMSMSPGAFEGLKKSMEEASSNRVRQALLSMADGNPPRTQLEARVAQAMRLVPGGPDKYRLAAEGDMVRVQAGIREKFALSVKRSGRYLPTMERIFQGYGLPVELTRLPFIESSFDITAYSSVGAAGIWQFMKGTAKNYMRVGGSIDERRDPFVSTRAAALYLKDAYNRLGAWPLAVTSYNHGVAGVGRKVRELGTSDISDIVEHPTTRLLGFASNNFYPEFLAAVEVYRERSLYFPDVRPDPTLQFTERPLATALTVRDASRRYGVSAEALQLVNFALGERIWANREKIPQGYPLRIPSPNIVVASTEASPQVSAIHGSTLTHVAREGETVNEIAVKYDTAPDNLRKMNRIPPDADEVAPGVALLVKTPDERAKMKGGVRRKTETVKLYHRVQKGDTLTSIGKRYGVSIEQLRRLNALKKRGPVVGEQLLVKTEQRAVAETRKAEAPKSRKGSKAKAIAKAKGAKSEAKRKSSAAKGGKGKKTSTKGKKTSKKGAKSKSVSKKGAKKRARES